MGEELAANYEVKYLNCARREMAKLFKKREQVQFCITQAKLLRFFPARSGSFDGRFFNLDIKKIESCWELRVWDKILEHKNIRIMLAVFSQPREIVVLSVYAKKSQQTPKVVKIRCRKRLRMLRRQGYK